MSAIPLITPVMISPEMTNISTQTTIYIDEKGGSDDHGRKGTKADPFATLFTAYVSFPPESSTPPPTFFTRIDTTKSDPSVPEWKEATKSAIKKVVARYAEHLKKVHRVEEEEAKRQLALIDARKVVIHQDESLPAAIKMKISAKAPKGVTLGNEISTGTRVRVVGRIENIRASKTRTFVYLSDTRGVLVRTSKSASSPGQGGYARPCI